MKLCKNCKHISYSETMCERPTGEKTSLVSGTTYVSRMNVIAEKERSFNYFNSIIHKACGKAGRFFEDNTEELLKRRLADEELAKNYTIKPSNMPSHSMSAHHHGAITGGMTRAVPGPDGFYVCDGSPLVYRNFNDQMRQDILDKLQRQVVNPSHFKLQNWAMSTIKPTFKVEPLV